MSSKAGTNQGDKWQATMKRRKVQLCQQKSDSNLISGKLGLFDFDQPLQNHFKYCPLIPPIVVQSQTVVSF